MSDNIAKIFNALDAAQSIEDVEQALSSAETMPRSEQKAFLSKLSDHFKKNSDPSGKSGFKVINIHPLDANDLKQGFHIVFKG